MLTFKDLTDCFVASIEQVTAAGVAAEILLVFQ